MPRTNSLDRWQLRVGWRPKFPRCGRFPQGCHRPGSAAAELHDGADQGFFIPPGAQKRPELAAVSPPIRGKRWGAGVRRRAESRKSSNGGAYRKLGPNGRRHGNLACGGNVGRNYSRFDKTASLGWALRVLPDGRRDRRETDSALRPASGGVNQTHKSRKLRASGSCGSRGNRGQFCVRSRE